MNKTKAYDLREVDLDTFEPVPHFDVWHGVVRDRGQAEVPKVIEVEQGAKNFFVRVQVLDVRVRRDVSKNVIRLGQQS